MPQARRGNRSGSKSQLICIGAGERYPGREAGAGRGPEIQGREPDTQHWSEQGQKSPGRPGLVLFWVSQGARDIPAGFCVATAWIDRKHNFFPELRTKLGEGMDRKLPSQGPSSKLNTAGLCVYSGHLLFSIYTHFCPK